MKGNCVVAKLLFLISVYEFPYYCNTIYLIIMIKVVGILVYWIALVGILCTYRMFKRHWHWFKKNIKWDVRHQIAAYNILTM